MVICEFYVVLTILHTQRLNLLSEITFGCLIYPGQDFPGNFLGIFWQEYSEEKLNIPKHLTFFAKLSWLAKCAYFADIFSWLNGIGVSLQGKDVHDR